MGLERWERKGCVFIGNILFFFGKSEYDLMLGREIFYIDKENEYSFIFFNS